LQIELVVIQKKIYEIRGHRVMLDFDLAVLYKVETRILNQAVRRNLNRFPPDFMFQITRDELKNLKSQFVISSSEWGGSRHVPFAFTEHGVTMLSSILKSNTAVNVNISIVRAFVMMRQLSVNYKELVDKITKLEDKYNKKFADVYEALDLLLQENVAKEDFSKRRRIGYKIPKRKS